MDCEVSDRGIESLRREYQTLINAGLEETHEWLDNEDEILNKCSLLPRENIKVSFAQAGTHSGMRMMQIASKDHH